MHAVTDAAQRETTDVSTCDRSHLVVLPVTAIPGYRSARDI